MAECIHRNPDVQASVHMPDLNKTQVYYTAAITFSSVLYSRAYRTRNN